MWAKLVKAASRPIKICHRLSGHQEQAASNGTESTVSRISVLTVISNPVSLHPLTLSLSAQRRAETADRGASEFPPSLMGLIGGAEARRMSDVQSRGWLWIGYGTTWVLVLF
jgi:hypothetical protein